jgi:hypothetical protein
VARKTVVSRPLTIEVRAALHGATLMETICLLASATPKMPSRDKPAKARPSSG